LDISNYHLKVKTKIGLNRKIFAKFISLKLKPIKNHRKGGFN